MKSSELIIYTAQKDETEINWAIRILEGNTSTCKNVRFLIFYNKASLVSEPRKAIFPAFVTFSLLRTHGSSTAQSPYILCVHHIYCAYTIYVLSTEQSPYIFSL